MLPLLATTIVPALMTAVIGFIFLGETKDTDIVKT